jgi:hypothetical protein
MEVCFEKILENKHLHWPLFEWIFSTFACEINNTLTYVSRNKI